MSDRMWTRIAAAGGIFYVVLTLLGNDVLGSSGDAPGITATGAQIGAYVRTHPPTALSWAALYIELLGILAFVFFLGSLWSVLRRAGEHGPFSAIAFGAGLVSVGVKIASLPAAIAAFYRAQEGMDPQLAAALLDMNGVSFVLTWAIDAVLLAATAVVILRTGALPRWLGWTAAVLSPALLIGVVFATSFGFVPYVLYTTLWIVATSIVLIRRAGEPHLVEKGTPVGRAASVDSAH